MGPPRSTHFIVDIGTGMGHPFLEQVELQVDLFTRLQTVINHLLVGSEPAPWQVAWKQHICGQRILPQQLGAPELGTPNWD